MKTKCKVCNKKEATNFECSDCYTKGFAKEIKRREEERRKGKQEEKDRILKIIENTPDNPFILRPSTRGEDNAVRKFKRVLKDRISLTKSSKSTGGNHG